MAAGMKKSNKRGSRSVKARSAGKKKSRVKVIKRAGVNSASAARSRKAAKKIPTPKTKSQTRSVPKKPPASITGLPSSLVLYVYGISEVPAEPFSVSAEAVDARGIVEPVTAGEYVYWTSRVSREEFADNLQQNMQELEWLAGASI